VADEDLASESPWLPPCAPPTGKRVAIVGTGPAGLSAAWYLLQRGHACTLFDDHNAPGGMLRRGVPEEDLPRDVLDAEIALIGRLGARFQCGTRLGAHVSVAELRQEWDAVLLAVGDVRGSAEPLGVALGPQGIRTDRTTMMTSEEGVFAAGAARAPTRHAIRSLADGRAAADAIHRHLGGRSTASAWGDFTSKVGRLAADEARPFLARGLPEPRLAPSAGRSGGFSTEEARREALRCLHCECDRAADCILRAHAGRLGANALRYRSERRPYERDDSHPLVVYESGKCIACGICVRIAAEAGEELGLTFTGRGMGLRMQVPFGGRLAEGLRAAARACAEACPTGALVLRTEPAAAPDAAR